ncbi:hypothetical protein K0U27_07375 [archaeon]|nr:hypothetical protein [archaeon]
MAQTCRGICERVKSTAIANSSRYKMGQKWCSLCALFFLTKENACLCCKTRLRTSPRSKKYDLPRM